MLMDNDKFGRSVNNDQVGQVEAESEIDGPDASDLRAVSAESYERRSSIWIQFKRGDWWIAVGLYLIFASVAFVVLT